MGVSPRFAAGAAMPEFIGGSRPRGTASFRGKPWTGPRATTSHDEAITQSRARRARARRRAEAGRSRRGLVRAAPRPVESFDDFYRRESSRLLVLARVLAGDAAAED